MMAQVSDNFFLKKGLFKLTDLLPLCLYLKIAKGTSITP